jgi:uncharacterized protein (DUF4415 family)
MSEKFISKTSRTDWERINTMNSEEIDLSDIPEITNDQIARAALRIGGKPVPKGTVKVNLALDAEVVAYFKAQSKPLGKAYQSLINEVLKASIRTRNWETILRRVIREELHAGR